MKGVVLGISPHAALIDICHEVRSYDILDGAITVAQACPYFPTGTIHVVVVDPGVGTERRPIIAKTGRHIFVCPDNGVLSFIYMREPHTTVRHVTNTHYFLGSVSNTFHGRDIFAPVAAHIAAGVPLEEFGPHIEDYVRLDIPKPQISNGVLRGSILKIDKFGNVITNITAFDLEKPIRRGVPLRVRVGTSVINELKANYGAGVPGELIVLFDSLGFLEIAINQSSAAERLQVRPGFPVEIPVE